MTTDIIRIGRIEYTNVWPVFQQFDPQRLGFPAELVTQVPAELNRRIQEGAIDIAAISSYAYAQAADDLLLLPGLSVSAYGRVRSVLLFHRKPLAEVASGTVALTRSSATSVNLLKIILAKRYGGSPSYVTMKPDLDRMMSSADAALLIGDDAIKASWANTGYEVTDLASEWTSWTGHWMTFAVWAVRRSLAESRPDMVSAVVRAFQESKEKGRRNRSAVVNQAMSAFGGTEAYWNEYFDGLSHDFGAGQQAGLAAYLRYARELGLLERDVPLRIWNDTTVAQVNE
ncbi:menaquinone biosynthesis protein [Paenibacillus thermoaerophilus]|nr:menaquinone biosynthesis protein [Paenibacillus thermoaerophilus]